FQAYRSRDIRLDHELFDQAVRLKTLRNNDAVDLAVLADDDLAFRQVEVERGAGIASPAQNFEPGPQVLQGVGDVVATANVLAVERLLRLLVGQLRGRAYH